MDGYLENIKKRLVQYNVMLDLVSQIEITLGATDLFVPALILQKCQELKAQLFYEMKILERDVGISEKD